jgi:hypothetical protein
MKRTRLLPVPQKEFPFAAEVFNLFSDWTLDGARLVREQAALDAARRQAEAAQAPLFPATPKRRVPQ